MKIYTTNNLPSKLYVKDIYEAKIAQLDPKLTNQEFVDKIFTAFMLSERCK